MHEAGLVSDLIADLLIGERASPRAIRKIRVRIGSGESPEAIQEAFHVLSAGTPLARAKLEILPSSPTVDCACGRSFHASHEQVLCGVAVCPTCEAICTVSGGHALEVVRLVADA